MKSLNRFLGITAAVLASTLIVCIIISVGYVSTHKTMFNGMNYNVSGDNIQFSWPWSNNERSSQFETLTETDSSEFKLPANIFINAGMEEIIFIEEARENVLVEYYSEHPDTPLYNIEYSSELVDDTLYIESSNSINDLYLDKEYDSYIKIYVPVDFELNTLDLTMSLGEVKQESIMNNVRNLNITANLGNVDLEITTPKDNLSVNCAMGSIDLIVSDKVNTFDSQANFGEVTLVFKDTVGSIISTADLGSLEITAEDKVSTVDISAKMGSITCDFLGHVDNLTATCDMGSIDLTFSDNDDSSAYVNADLGNVDVDSSIALVSENSDPDFRLSANMGDIQVNIR